MTCLVAQISRGMAPAAAIAQAVTTAIYRSAAYELIAALPGVEAKNRAVELALARGMDLLLVEDDVLADTTLWTLAIAEETAVTFAEAICRDHQSNTHHAADGSVLYSGTIFVKIPLAILRRLIVDPPIFRAYDFRVIDGALHPIGPNRVGRGSDVYFWWRLRQLDPVPPIRCLGRVGHIMHPLNSGKHDLAHPCEMTVL